MKFVLAGGSGFLGTALRDHLAREGHEVIRLVRRTAASQNESQWYPERGIVDRPLIETADVVVNLAGAPIAHWPWTEDYKLTLLKSRTTTTETLANAIAKTAAEGRPRPAFIVQNGIAGYGDRGDEVLTEQSSTGADTTLGRITQAWQDAATPAIDVGARVCVMRTGVVLDKRGGALKPLLLQFRVGAGGPTGNGKQYFPTISLTDWLRAVTFLATDQSCSGVYNVSGPNATTNEQFAKELGRMVHRPTFVRAPAWPMRKVLGDLSNEFLFSARVEPERLLAAGFVFEHPTLNARLVAALSD